MRYIVTVISTLAAPVAAVAQTAPSALPSVAEAQAEVQRANQLLEAAKAYEAAKRERAAAEAKVAAAARVIRSLRENDLVVPAAAPAPAAPAVALSPPAVGQPVTPAQTPLASVPAPPQTAFAAAATGVTTTVTATPDGKIETKVEPTSQRGLADNGTGRQKFGGIDFGIGIAASYDLGNNRRVKGAEIVDGLLRVTQTENVRARLILESHYFFTPLLPFTQNYAGVACDSFQAGSDQYDDCVARRKNFGIGPFMAIQPGTDNVIDAIGAGVMFGFRRREDKASSFNIGFGVLYDVDTQILGDGFVENQPPPGNEQQVRFRRQSQSGLLVMTSYTF